MKPSYHFILGVALSLSASLTAFAQPGSIDLTFSSDGMAMTNLGSDFDEGNAVAIQPDGKILVAGRFFSPGVDFYHDYALVRYNVDGSLDASFGVGGVVTTDFGNSDDYPYSIAIQTDGKILVCGSSNQYYSLARYNIDGNLDSNFGVNGIITDPSLYGTATSISIQSDDKIVVVGVIYLPPPASYQNCCIVRYNTDGSFDTSFGTGGIITNGLGSGDGGYSAAIQNDGKIVVAGWRWESTLLEDFSLFRYNDDGSMDNTFGTNGNVSTDFGLTADKATSVAIQSNGKIVVAGYSNNNVGVDFAVVRYNTDGSLDAAFGDDGKVITDFEGFDERAYSMAIQTDGKIVLAGESHGDFALTRYNTDGSLDMTFDTDGIVTTDFGTDGYAGGHSVEIGSDGKIVVAGFSLFTATQYDFAVARYIGSGSIDIADDFASINAINFYPNPFSNDLTVKGTNGQGDIMFSDALGREVHHQKTTVIETNINTEKLSPGFYSIFYIDGDKTVKMKLVKM